MLFAKVLRCRYFIWLKIRASWKSVTLSLDGLQIDTVSENGQKGDNRLRSTPVARCLRGLGPRFRMHRGRFGDVPDVISCTIVRSDARRPVFVSLFEFGKKLMTGMFGSGSSKLYNEL